MESVSNAAAVEAIASIAQQASDRARTVIAGPDGRQWLALPDGSGALKLHELVQEGRERTLNPIISQHVVLIEQRSFIEYIDDFKTPTGRLFAKVGRSGEGATISAVMDYHTPAIHTPGRLEHSAVYQLQDSEEWTRWSGISGKLQDQATFVRFLEENACDIEAPQAADILEIARDFSAARRVNFTQTLRTQTGDTSFEYTQEAEAKTKSGHIEVPNLFRLRIAVFYGEPPMEILAYLRWSISDGTLKLGIELHRPVFIRQSLLEQIARNVSERTALPLHFGSYGSR